MISKDKPADFTKRFDIVGCFMLHQGKFLMLHRHPHKASGDRWGLPAGKAEPGEGFPDAMLREIKEETGFDVLREKLRFFGSYFVRDGDFDFGWHMFSIELDSVPDVLINPHEHSEFRWVTQAEASTLSLIPDQHETMQIFFADQK